MKNPKIFREEFLKQYGLNESKRIAFDFFLEKYIRGSSSNLIKQFKDLFIGNFYTFNYLNPKHKDILDFYDTQPIILVLNSYFLKDLKRHIVMGINFNFMPFEIKSIILEILYTEFYKYAKIDKLNYFNLELFKQDSKFYEILNYLFEQICKLNLTFLIRKYIWRKMERINFIDYDDWGYIQFIDTKFIVGKDLNEIYKQFLNFKNF